MSNKYWNNISFGLWQVNELEYLNDYFTYIYVMIVIIYMVIGLILYRVAFDIFRYKHH